MIKAIYIADSPNHQRSRVTTALVEAKKGIVGDRNYALSKYPGQNVTFIEIEEIDRYNADHGQNVGPWEFGRNLVTEGIRLNDLVGKSFSVGTARFRGVELCEPCATLGDKLSNASMPQKKVVEALVHRAGIRTDVIHGGVIEEGMSVKLHSEVE